MTQDIAHVRRFAYSLTGNKHDADDLVQNIAVRILRSGVPDIPNPLSWVFRVCKNLWIDETRSRALRSTTSTEELFVEQASDTRPYAELVLDTERTILALQKLPENQKIALSLVSVEGLSYVEASEIMSVPVGTIMSRIARARKNLLKELDGIRGDVQNG